MGLNACSCLRSFDDLSVETDLNRDGEIEGFNLPNNNHNIISIADDSTNLTGAGRMSYLMKVNTYDSGATKNTAFYSMKTGAAVERIQSVFRGSNFRKKFQKNMNEQLNNKNNKENEKHNEDEKDNEKSHDKEEENGKDNNKKCDKDDKVDNYEINDVNDFDSSFEITEDDFISEKTKKAEQNFDGKLDYENGWKKYVAESDEIDDSKKEKFSQQKLNEIINNNPNLKATKEEGNLIFINKQICLFKGQMEKNEDINNNLKLVGKGELYLRNGVKYEGIFFDGKLNGIGRYINDKFICFEGIFNNGVLEGKGTRIQMGEDGNKKIYIGDLKNYIKEGKGKLTNKSYTYEGDFANDKKQGKGKLIYKEDGNIYEGEFNNDDINGYGLFTFSNKHTYEGQFVNGKFHGKGIYKWPDGCYYKGEYINGVREGKGEYKFSNGKIYTGPFTKGKPNGKGVITMKDNTFDCEFNNGKLMTNLKSLIVSLNKTKKKNI